MSKLNTPKNWPQKEKGRCEMHECDCVQSWNAAIDQCNACVMGITENDFDKVIQELGYFSDEEDGFAYTIDERHSKIISSAIVKHIKERLS